MKKNIGFTDKSIRIIVALVIVLLFFMNAITGALGIALLVVAGVLVATSLINFCPLYSLLGVNTCKIK